MEEDAMNSVWSDVVCKIVIWNVSGTASIEALLSSCFQLVALYNSDE